MEKGKEGEEKEGRKKQLDQIFFLIPYSLFLAFMGCLATQQDLSSLQGEIQRLNTHLAEMRKSQADLAANISELDSRIIVLKESLSSSTEKNSQLLQHLEDMEAHLLQKMQLLSIQLSTAIAEGSLPTPGDLFQNAYRDFTRSKYDLAIQGFLRYLESYPKGSIADQALYYMGECYSAQKMWSKAASQYQQLLQKHPKSLIAPSAKLKLAIALLKESPRNLQAKELLIAIEKEFPGTSEAAAAKEHLKKLSLSEKKQSSAKSGKKKG